MPLHLLGKKSWNVYNQDNIERVKRDEAIAKAKVEAEEQRMQEVDADRRMQILRGEIPTTLLEIEDKPEDGHRGEDRHGSGRERKRRKKAGENDTDFEMRLAQDKTSASDANKQIVLRKSVDAPLVDHSGHIDLFPQPVQKNVEAEKETAKKKKEYEDQYTMRFSNAAGFKQGLENPWYSKSSGSKEAVEDEITGRDVWGNEDPRRKEREVARMVSNDPLAAMRRGAAQVRQVEKERKRWREEKEKEMRSLEESERRRKKYKRRYEGDDNEEDDLENFRLDKSEESSTRREREHDREHRHRYKESKRRSHWDKGSRHRPRHRHSHSD